MEENPERTDYDLPCKICRKEKASALGILCVECLKKYGFPK
jgi:hypothetical protein